MPGSSTSRWSAQAAATTPARAATRLAIVSFPDAESFAAYQRDPEIAALATLRAAAIRQTLVWAAPTADANSPTGVLFPLPLR
jgi:hypothetical protein